MPESGDDKGPDLNMIAELHNQLISTQDEIKNLTDNMDILLQERGNRQVTFQVRYIFLFNSFRSLYTFTGYDGTT